ncbi:hypothetical protein [Halalkalibacter alkalisediminis]|uniref:Transglycosylase n=1 Tax=Halalkalibacter alkalisediminis TaxID=935616 RepID=A0ABV6NHD8_9BACI|nr:hypothetical protein [Halalkalibacter alkalisediminis]
MSYELVCDHSNCGEKFILTSDDIKREKLGVYNGEVCYKCFFICPRCGTQYIAQIESNSINGRIETIENLLTKRRRQVEDDEISKAKQTDKTIQSKKEALLMKMNKIREQFGIDTLGG